MHRCHSVCAIPGLKFTKLTKSYSSLWVNGSKDPTSSESHKGQPKWIGESKLHGKDGLICKGQGQTCYWVGEATRGVIEHLQEHMTLIPRAHTESREQWCCNPVMAKWKVEAGRSLELCAS